MCFHNAITIFISSVITICVDKDQVKKQTEKMKQKTNKSIIMLKKICAFFV